MTLLVLVLLALASYRAWRLVGRDDITSFWRRPLPDYALRGVECPWCLGTWVTAAACVLVETFVYDFVSGRILNRGGFIALVVAAVAAVVGFLGELDGKLSS